MVKAYFEALQDELDRAVIAPAIEADSDLGYRGYSWWYAYYSCLRQHLGNIDDWDIYSGTRNPVMCWKPSWNRDERHERGASNKCSTGMFFLELNYSSLLLKFAWQEKMGTATNVTSLRQALQTCSGELNRYGFRVCLRGSEANRYTALAKLEINVEQPLDVVSQAIRNFLPDGFNAIVRQLLACLPRTGDA
ncbi:MAG: hypothetical protein ABFD92_07440 [Planctomycetaceae bacterium]|nr:hypothetical protein [Planctomycetaceae bacterium]